ncbi:methylmalonyl Co-A mutase-associated GTPase MeaB [Calderihabitans maritimus]|uniref:AAA+ ATPase domain-containing protein n=1 Tax=Calderihabitans maritimus TaxID=1246530 RepID=A0A1Z5HTU5_9FIRM|nr:methylmalonyl Co-A mutase-associated GTPase MeaB [Calderihabitans maritimus]GAW92959.1 hypothetical protein KKC1_21040 [Calderihabitans maritimus]
MSWEKFWPGFQRGDPWAISQLINLVENESPNKEDIMKAVAALKREAYVVGFTGPPGAGKSTLIYQLVRLLVAKGFSVGVVCVDPTSPFTGGALLGDRIRMMELNKRAEVFIRSLATRGSLGGISRATKDVVEILAAAGKEIVLVETVGTGQIEFDIMDVADTIIVVTVPGLGDRVQTLKAGIMEIGDLFVVNQADREGAKETVRDLEIMVEEAKIFGWKPRVLATEAVNNRGIEKLYQAIQEHKNYLQQTNIGTLRRQQRNVKRLMEIVQVNINKRMEEYLENNSRCREIVDRVKEGGVDPYSGAAIILASFLRATCREWLSDTTIQPENAISGCSIKK